MLSASQEKLIKSLHTKKGRDTSGLCLVEGSKVIRTVGKAIDFVFSPMDTKNFSKLVTTETPQELAAVARIPQYTMDAILKSPTVVVLDGVQDPGNVGSILRLCLGFNASLILVESADPASPKVIRSSVGAMFQVPWITCARKDVQTIIEDLNRPVYRLEGKKGAHVLTGEYISNMDSHITVIAGSEGQGIQLDTTGTSIKISHHSRLESLNVGHALAILLAMRYESVK